MWGVFRESNQGVGRWYIACVLAYLLAYFKERETVGLLKSSKEKDGRSKFASFFLSFFLFFFRLHAFH